MADLVCLVCCPDWAIGVLDGISESDEALPHVAMHEIIFLNADGNSHKTIAATISVRPPFQQSSCPSTSG